MNRTSLAALLVLSALACAPAATGQSRLKPKPPRVVEQVEDEEYERNARWFYEERAYPFGTIPPDARRKALDAWKRIEAGTPAHNPRGARTPAAAPGRAWRSIGPTPTTARISAISPVSGRIHAVALSPADSRLVLVGSAVGGVWRSEDGGATFTPVTDDQIDLAVGALAFAPSDPSIVYAGMGEEYLGSGVLKSTDAGRTWRRVSGDSLPTPGEVTGLVVDPSDPNRLYLAQYSGLGEDGVLRSSGVYTSTDGGATWRRTLAGLVRDLAMSPADPRVLFACMRRVDEAGDRPPGLYRSTDSGRTWSLAYEGPFEASSLPSFSVAVTPADPNRVYLFGAGRTNNVVGKHFATSTDGGRTFRSGGGGAAPTTSASFLVASPGQASTLYLGFPGGDVFKSTDSGVTFVCLSNGYCDGTFGRNDEIHVDQLSLVVDPADDARILVGNDGGLYESLDRGSNWRSLNASLSLVTFRSVAIHPNNPTLSFGGTQDNGTQRRSNGSEAWTEIITGDGGQIVFNPLDPSIVFTTYIYGSIYRWSQDGTVVDDQVAANTTFGESTSGPRIAFYPPFTGDGVSRRLYFGTWRLFVSDDLGETWTAPASLLDLTRGETDVLTAIGVGPANRDVIYTGSAQGRVMVSADGGRTWREAGRGLPDRTIKQILVDRANPNVAYLSVSGFRSGHVFKTVDMGSTWTDISGLLPDIPASALHQDPLDPNTIYVGTDIGVFRSTSAGAAWESLSEGLPPTVVLGFASHPSGVVQAATYGRGAYELGPGSGTAPDYALSLGPAEVTVARGGRVTAALNVVRMNGFDASVSILAARPGAPGLKVKPSKTTLADAGVTVTVKAKRNAAPGRYEVVFAGRSAGGVLRTGTLAVTVQ